MEKFNVHQEVTNKIIQAMEKHKAEGYRNPWLNNTGIPTNASTHNQYQGINVPMLWLAQEANGYTTPEFASYKQWQEKGAQVKKGEKGNLVVFYKTIETKDKETGEEKRAHV